MVNHRQLERSGTIDEEAGMKKRKKIVLIISVSIVALVAVETK